MSCGCGTFGCYGGCGYQVQPPACNCPPSPTPPWSRPTQSPLNQMLVDTAVPIVLDPDITYLNQSQSQSAPINNAMVLPNGNYLKQMKRIYIPGSAIATTATWILSGTFAGGFGHLTFNTIGTAAWLEWDGTSWQLIGGNAALGA